MLTGKWIAAICAAPTLLAGLGLLKGKKAVCYPTCEKDMTEAIIGEKLVEVEDKIITSKAAGTSGLFAKKIIEVLRSKEQADRVYKTMYY